MSIHILSLLICAFICFGLFVVMNDAESVIKIFKCTDLKIKLLICVGIIIVAQVVTQIKFYLILFLVIEYIAILLWYGKHKKRHFKPALNGIFCIMMMLLVEIAIIKLYYWNYGENFDNIGMHRKHEMQMACYLTMALVQYCLILFKEIKRENSKFRNALMLADGIKALEDIVWLYICVWDSMFGEKYIIISGLFILAIAIDYIVYFLLVLRISEKNEQEKIEHIHINAYEYYLKMEEEHRQIRKIYHEMKNQMMIMEENKENSNNLSILQEEKISELSKRIEKVHQFYHTGCSSLDMFLLMSEKRAKGKGIEFEAKIAEGCLSFMNQEDINIIFTNAIINAIEACEKITDGKKEIKIKAGENLNDTLIYVKNTVSSERKKGILRTSKKNSKLHGIGMISIQECVEKYNGYVSIEEDESTFQLAILFGKG